MAVLTCFLFVLEVRGYSKLYDSVDDSKYGKSLCLQTILVDIYTGVKLDMFVPIWSNKKLLCFW